MRKAIEEVNSGTFVTPEDDVRDTPDKEPKEDAPLLTQNMISAMETDSIELDKGEPKKEKTVNNNNSTNNNKNGNTS